jgi:hypothetical protein
MTMGVGLIRNLTLTDHSTLEDLLLVMAKNVEDSLLEAGAKPGKDYTLLDLYKLAQPFALETFKGGKINFTTSWPSAKG